MRFLAGGGDGKAAYARLADQAVRVPSPATERLGEIARTHGLWLAVGANELDGGTLYNALLVFSPEGTLALRHRKLMPTNHERLVWGLGDGSGLEAVETPLGRMGGLICWENLMPLARFALYETGIELYLAPTADDSEEWHESIKHIARESRCFVVSSVRLPARVELSRRHPARRRPRADRPRRLARSSAPTGPTSPGRSGTRRGSSSPSSTRNACTRSASASTPPGTTTARTCSASSGGRYRSSAVSRRAAR